MYLPRIRSVTLLFVVNKTKYSAFHQKCPNFITSLGLVSYTKVQENSQKCIQDKTRSF